MLNFQKIFYTSEVNIEKDLLVNPKMKIETEEEALESLKIAYTVLENAHFTHLDSIKTPLLEAISEAGKKNGQSSLATACGAFWGRVFLAHSRWHLFSEKKHLLRESKNTF